MHVQLKYMKLLIFDYLPWVAVPCCWTLSFLLHPKLPVAPCQEVPLWVTAIGRWILEVSLALHCQVPHLFPDGFGHWCTWPRSLSHFGVAKWCCFPSVTLLAFISCDSSVNRHFSSSVIWLLWDPVHLAIAGWMLNFSPFKNQSSEYCVSILATSKEIDDLCVYVCMLFLCMCIYLT